MPKLFVFICLLALLTQCRAQPGRGKTAKAAAKQPHSLCGTVVEKRGNQMPGPGRSSSKGEPVAREVAVFPLVSIDQVVSDEAGFITDLKTAKPLQSVQSGPDGKFCFDGLPDGSYSILVHEPKGWYANSFDTQNHLNPVQVQSGKMADLTIQITYRAAF